MGLAVTSPARTGTPVTADLRIAAIAGQAVQSCAAQHHGHSARAAHAWIDTLHNRAHRAAERRRTRNLPR
ncbi:hypothetical protein EV589_5999 [Mycobacterium sp. BK558]|nr:hypothetical protein EV589_5999 [Mycobacterium sp. BK558]